MGELEKDYITEKFWKILPYNVIPIVLNCVDMTTVAPPHSYIDIKDFKSFDGLYLHIFNIVNSTFINRFC